MMKLTLTIPRSGPGGSFGIGAEIEVPEAEGARMIAAGQAVALEDAPAKPKRGGKKAETATAADASEKAVE